MARLLSLPKAPPPTCERVRYCVSTRNKLVHGRLQDQDIYQICEFINIIYFRERLVVLIGNITSCNETFANPLMYLDNSSIELSLWWPGRIKRDF